VGDEESFNDEDSAPQMSKSVVFRPFFDWENDRPPRIPLPIDFMIPDLGIGDAWRIEFDTAVPQVQTDDVVTIRAKEWLTVAGRSVTAISMAAAPA
jgi:pullulanase/glycogen debranching enzyme